MGVEIKRSNSKALMEMSVHLNALAAVESKVGWFQGAKYEDGTPVAYVAAIQELGSGPIPPRSFMRSTATEKGQTKWATAAAKVSKRVVDGKMSAYDAMDVLGQVAQEDIKEKINTITEPPLSQITLLARKRKMEGKTINGTIIGRLARKVFENDVGDLSGVSDKPLIDSTLMISSLTHKTTSV